MAKFRLHKDTPAEEKEANADMERMFQADEKERVEVEVPDPMKAQAVLGPLRTTPEGVVLSKVRVSPEGVILEILED